METFREKRVNNRYVCAIMDGDGINGDGRSGKRLEGEGGVMGMEMGEV